MSGTASGAATVYRSVPTLMWKVIFPVQDQRTKKDHEFVCVTDRGAHSQDAVGAAYATARELGYAPNLKGSIQVEPIESFECSWAINATSTTKCSSL